MADVIGQAVIRIVPDTTGFATAVQSQTAGATAAIGGLGAATADTTAQFRAANATMISTGATLTKAVTLPVAALGVAVVKTGLDFETAMLQVQAVSDATGMQFEELSELAKELGRTTQFSATQAADAMGFLAMAGFEVQEILDSLPGVLNLAAAGNLDLATAADLASNILSGYALQANEIGRVNDVLAQTFTSANTSLAQLGEAFKFVAPVAAASSLEFEEVNAALGLLGNAGIQASMAGTTLRGAIAKLNNPAQEAQEALDRLGVSVFDAQGVMLPLVDIIEQFETAGLSTADAMTIFGLRAGPGFAALVSQGSDALRTLTEENRLAGGEIEAVGEVAGFSESQIESLTMAFTDSLATVQEYGFNIDETTGLLGAFVSQGQSAEEATESLTGVLTALGTETQAVADLLGFQVDALGNLVTVNEDGTESIVGLTEVIARLESQGFTTEQLIAQFGETVGTDLAAALEFGTEGLLEFFEANQQAGRGAEIAEVQMSGLRGAGLRLKSAFEGLLISIAESGIIAGLTGLAEAGAVVFQALAELPGPILATGAALAGLAAAIGPVIAAKGLLQRALFQTAAAQAAVNTGALTNITTMNLLRVNLDAARASAAGFARSLAAFALNPLTIAVGATAAALFLMWQNSEDLREAVRRLASVFDGVFTPILTSVGDALATVANLLADGVAAAAEFLGDKLAILVNGLAALLEGGLELVSDFITDAVIPAFETLAGFVEDSVLPVLGDALTDVADSIVMAWGEVVDFFDANVLPVFEDVASFFEDILGPAIGEVQDFVDGFTEGFDNLIGVLTGGEFTVFGFAVAMTQMLNLSDEAVLFFFNIGSAVVDAFSFVRDEAIPALGDFATILGGKFLDAAEDVASVVGGVLMEGLEAVTDSVEALTELWDDMTDAIEDGVDPVETFAEFMGELIGVGDDLVPVFEDFEDIIRDVTDAFEPLSDAVGSFFDGDLSSASDSFGEFAEEISEIVTVDIPAAFDGLIEAIRPALSSAGSSAARFFTESALPEIRTFVTQTIPTELGKLADFIGGPASEAAASFLDGLVQSVRDVPVVGPLAEALSALIQNTLGQVAGRIDLAAAIFSGDSDEIRSSASELAGGLVDTLSTVIFELLPEALSELGGVIGGPIEGAISEAFGSLTDITADTPIVGALASAIETILTTAVSIVGDTFDFFGALFGGDFEGAGEELQSVATTLADAIGSLLGEAIPMALQGLGEVLAGPIAAALRSGFALAAEELEDVPLLGPLVSGLEESLPSLTESIGNALSEVGESAEGFDVSEAISGVRESFEGVVDFLDDRFGPAIDSVKDGVEDLVEPFEDNLGPILETIGEAFSEDILPSLRQLAGPLGKIANVVGLAVWFTFETLVEAIAQTFETIAAVLGPVLNVAFDVLRGIIEELADAFSSLVDFIDGFVTLIEGIVTLDPVKIFEGIKGVITGILGGLETLLLDLPTILAEALVGLGEALLGAVTTAWDVVLGFFTETAIPGIVSFFDPTDENSIWQRMVRAAVGAGTALWNGIKDTLTGENGFRSLFLDFILGLVEFFDPTSDNGLVKRAIAAAAGFGTTLWEGLKDGFGELTSGVSGVIDGVVDFFDPESPTGLVQRAIGFVSQIVTKMAEVGSAIKEGIIEGITGALDLGLDLAQSMKDLFVDVWNGLVDTLNTAWNAVDFTVSAFGRSLTIGLPDDTLLGLKLAEGGIFDQATPAIIGEAGAEVVIPLTDPQRALDLAERSGLTGLIATQLGDALGGIVTQGTGTETFGNLVSARGADTLAAAAINTGQSVGVSFGSSGLAQQIASALSGTDAGSLLGLGPDGGATGIPATGTVAADSAPVVVATQPGAVTTDNRLAENIVVQGVSFEQALAEIELRQQANLRTRR